MHYNFDEIINREGTNSVKYDLRKVLFNNEKAIPLWVADMDFKTPDFIIHALQKRLEHEILGYTMIPSGFYDAIVQWNYQRHKWNISKEWISFSPGVVPALNLLVMAFTQPGDSVLVQTPVYFPFFSAIKNHGRELVTNSLRYTGGKYSIDFDDLEANITTRTKMLFLCNPHNPTGNVWTPSDLTRIGELCLKHNILLISDEIHADLVYPGFHHTPIASMSDDLARISITCMAASKTFNLAGLSTAYLVIPDRQLKLQYEKILDQVHVGAGNIFGFLATEAAYREGGDWLRQLMDYLHENLLFLKEFIAHHIPMIRVVVPQATYLIWLDCSGLGMSSARLKAFMIHEAGLGMNDGLQFGREGEGFQRINIACPRQILYEALMKLKDAIHKNLKK